MLRAVLRLALLAGLAAVCGGGVTPAVAQVVPWLDSVVDGGLSRDASVQREPARPRSTHASATRHRPGRAAEPLPVPAAIDYQPEIDDGDGLLAFLPEAVNTFFATFVGAATDGAVRTGTTWVGQVSQQGGLLVVGGTARDDNGWGASGLTLDATGQSFLNITAQRDAGNLAPTLFIQFEDIRLRTKVVSVSTALFAFGSPTLVQVPLEGWTIDFGPSQIVSWSLGGGGLGTVDFRMTFDSLGFSATAIPERGDDRRRGCGAQRACGRAAVPTRAEHAARVGSGRRQRGHTAAVTARVGLPQR